MRSRSSVSWASAVGLLCACVFLVAACRQDGKGQRPDMFVSDEVTAVRMDRRSERAGGDPRARIPTHAPVVLFVGDGTMAGKGVANSVAFPAVLERWALEKGEPFRMVNAARIGETTKGALSRIGWLLKDRPAVVVIMLGRGDLVAGVPPSEIEEDLRAILRAANQARAVPVLVLPLLSEDADEDSRAALAGIYGRLAAMPGVRANLTAFEDFHGSDTLLMVDGIHPTSAGHMSIADRLGAQLEKIVSRAG